jgi:TatD DNase family protein
MQGIIDTHAHLDEIEKLDQVLTAAKSANVVGIVAVGSDKESNGRILSIARQHPGFIFSAIGLHPWNIKEDALETELKFIEEHVSETVAIGEIGLDYHKRVITIADKKLQKIVLTRLLKIAGKYKKVINVHSRYAWRDTFELVKEAKIEKAIFHWYTGPSSVLRDIINSGYYLSVTPAVEYHEEHRRAVKETPIDRLLLETDSPVIYQRGTENEFKSTPADVLRSLAGTAKLKGSPADIIADATSVNAMRIFGLQNKP